MEAEKSDHKGRLLKRLAVLAVRHARVVSLVCTVSGIIFLFLLPLLAKSVYVDENALLPGSARATLTHSDAVTAHELGGELQTLVAGSIDVHKDFQGWFTAHMNAIGADCYFQRFCPPSASGFLKPSSTYTAGRWCEVHGREDIPGVNAVGIVRAAQGEGNEAIVLVTPFQLGSLTSEAAETIGLTLALLQLLSRSPWLAKDVVWVAAESKYGAYVGVSAWLKEYHEPSSVRDVELSDSIFKRAGSIAAAFVLELNSSSGTGKQNDIEVRVEGTNGQMPNMDMISIVNLLVSWRQNFQMTREGVPMIAGWRWLKFLGSVQEIVGRQVADFQRTFLPHTKKTGLVTAEDYVNRISTLARSCWDQMLGVPTGAHGAFRDYQVDAVTLHVTSHRTGKVDLTLDLGRLVDGVLRSVNNLLEKFHQSLFLYIMVAPDKFVSISTYIIPLALLLASFPIQAASLCSRVKSGSHSSWTNAAVLVIVVEVWSLACAFLPAVIWPLFDSTEARVAVWTTSSSFVLVILYVTLFIPSPRKSADWYIPLKALMLCLTGIALGVLSAVNFSVALVGTLLLLPMCLFVQPSIDFSKEARGVFGHVYAFLAPVVLLILTLPLMFILFLVLGVVQVPLSLSTTGVDIWCWGNAFYFLVFNVHLPCFIICVYILTACWNDL